MNMLEMMNPDSLPDVANEISFQIVQLNGHKIETLIGFESTGSEHEDRC